MKRTRAKKFKVRMFYHLQNLFWGLLACGFLSGVLLAVYVQGVFVLSSDFPTLYTSIPNDLLKSRMNNIINNAFKHKNGATRYTHIKVGRNKSYFTNDPLNGDNKCTANDICKMTEFWWITYMLGLVDSFSGKWLAFL